MHHVHPAACTECCKRHIDTRRRLPEFIEEAAYMARQAALFALCAIGIVLASPMFITAWLFGGRREAAGDAEPAMELRYYYPKKRNPITNIEAQTLHNQRTTMRALKHQYMYADENVKPALQRELETQQYIHEQYAWKVERDMGAR